MKRNKIIVTILILLLIIPQFTGCLNKSKSPYSATTFALDTVCEITIYDMKDRDAQEIISKAFKEIGRYEKLLSRTIEGSDVDRINKAKGQRIEVGDEILEILDTALRLSYLTDGRFDVTIGRLTSLYNFRDGTALPLEEDIKDAIKHINYEDVRNGEGELMLLDPDMMIDLGAIAKGYIAERLGEYLTSLGVENGVINLGGNVLAIGNKHGKGYKIGIKNPLKEDAILATVSGDDITVVTSGTYERYIDIDGTRYHHILDPKTGYPVDTDLVQVSVITTKEYGTEADCLSTILLILGSEEGLKFMEDIDYAFAIFVTEDGTCFSSSPEMENVTWIQE